MQWELRVSPTRIAKLTDLAVSLGGARIVGCLGFIELFVWDGATGELHRRLPLPRSNQFQQFLFLPDGRRFVASNSSDLAVWDVEAGARAVALEGGARFSKEGREIDLAVSQCGRVVAACALSAAGPAASLSMWDARSGRLLFRAERREEASWDHMCGVTVAPMTAMADGRLARSR